jgi:HEAT repeat protein/anti-sigma regulatory factor (Ser/Thr protein kinase)
MEHILRHLRRRNEELRKLSNPLSREEISSLYQKQTKELGIQLELNREDFSRAYFNPTIAETEVLPLFLGLVTEPDDFYTLLEQLPESLTFTSLRLRARGLAYVQRISREHLTNLTNQLLDFIIKKKKEDGPYEEIVIGSISMASNQALEFIVDRVASLIRENRAFEAGWAASALGEIGGARAVDILLTTLTGASGGARMQSAFALGKLRARRAVDHLRNAMKDQSPALRWSAAVAIGQIGDEQAVVDLLDRIRDDEALVRQSAAEALGKIGGDHAMAGLREASIDERVEVRLAAAFALGLLGDSKAEMIVLEILGDKENESDVRSRAASTLGEIGSEQSVRALFQALNDDDVEIRRAATYALGKIGTRGAAEDAIDALLEALKIDNNDVRWRAAWELGNIGANRAVEGLIEALRGREYSGTRWRAAEALGKIGGQQTEDALLETLRDEDNFVRMSAALALGRLGHSEVIDDCLAALNDIGDAKTLVRWRAAEALGKIGGKRAVPALLGALRDDLEVQEPAAKALAQISNEDLASGLIDAFSDSDRFVREKTAQIVGYYVADEQVLNELSRLATSDPFDEVKSAAYEGRERLLRRMRYLGVETETVTRAEEIGQIKILEESRAFIAHEVKNAIGPLRVTAQLLNETLTQSNIDRDKLAEYTRRIINQTNAAYEVVNRYIDYSRRLTPHLDPVDINRLLRSCLNEVRAECGQNRVYVNLQLGKTSKALVDTVLIEAVFRNALQNAIEAMECDGNLTIATCQDANRIIVTIRDTGPGVKPEHLDRVFELGFTTRMTKRGAGLGLWLVRRIVEEAHGGRVSMVNNPGGNGASLNIELPIAEKNPNEI